MAYGLKCFDASGYVTFDTDIMESYLRVSASGTVTLSGGATSSTITATGVDYIYVWSGPTTSITSTVADRYEIQSRLTDSFKIKNLSGSQITFNYIAFTR